MCPERRGELGTQCSPKMGGCPFQAEMELPFHSYYFPCFPEEALSFIPSWKWDPTVFIRAARGLYTTFLYVQSFGNRSAPKTNAAAVAKRCTYSQGLQNLVTSFEFILRNTEILFSPISQAKHLSVGICCCWAPWGITREKPQSSFLARKLSCRLLLQHTQEVLIHGPVLLSLVSPPKWPGSLSYNFQSLLSDKCLFSLILDTPKSPQKEFTEDALSIHK